MPLCFHTSHLNSGGVLWCSFLLVYGLGLRFCRWHLLATLQAFGRIIVCDYVNVNFYVRCYVRGAAEFDFPILAQVQRARPLKLLKKNLSHLQWHLAMHTVLIVLGMCSQLQKRIFASTPIQWGWMDFYCGAQSTCVARHRPMARILEILRLLRLFYWYFCPFRIKPCHADLRSICSSIEPSCAALSQRWSSTRE